MERSTVSVDEAFPEALLALEPLAESYAVPPLPRRHPAEADTFARQKAVPGHDQRALAGARIVLVGAGGLNSWTALGLARSGARSLTIVDPDLVERTNLPRQLYFAGDLGAPKALRLARHLQQQATDGLRVTGVAASFEEFVERFALAADLLIVGVDNNLCRLQAAQQARARRIPAVFTMLSRDGVRVQSFLQGPAADDACLWCALPNLDPRREAPCAAAIISTCFLASAFALFFAYRALMGWPRGVEPFNWREADALGATPDRTGLVRRRAGCPVCGPARGL